MSNPYKNEDGLGCLPALLIPALAILFWMFFRGY